MPEPSAATGASSPRVQVAAALDAAADPLADVAAPLAAGYPLLQQQFQLAEKPLSAAPLGAAWRSKRGPPQFPHDWLRRAQGERAAGRPKERTTPWGGSDVCGGSGLVLSMLLIPPLKRQEECPRCH